MAADPVSGRASTSPGDISAIVDRYLDRSYLVETLAHLAQVPTDVPMGFDTLIEPDDPNRSMNVRGRDVQTGSPGAVDITAGEVSSISMPIIRRIADVTRHGQSLSAVLAQTQSLPHDIPGLEAAWRASLTPPKNTDKKGDKKPAEKPDSE